MNKKPPSKDKNKEAAAMGETEIQKLVDELTLMGFPPAKAKKAIVASQSTVLNDLIDQILKDSSAMIEQPKPVSADQPAQKKWKPYSCEVCTYNNNNNPGPNCEICGSPAPADSEVIETPVPVAAPSESTMPSEQ